MDQSYTHISVILDRTGSMEPIRDDVIGGFNAFLKEQKQAPGKASLTLVQFDSQDPYEVIHDFKAIAAVEPLTRETFVPRATTPLLDALGRGINDLESRLARMESADRPSRVVMVIITDGQENASREFRKEQITRMIRDRQEKDDWQFVFLSADLSAIQDAVEQGIRPASAMSFRKDKKGTTEAWKSVSSRVHDYRTGRTDQIEFTQEDRDQQDSETK